METNIVTQPEKSAFVTVVAWIFIVISGLWTFTSFILDLDVCPLIFANFCFSTFHYSTAWCRIVGKISS